MFAEFHRLEFEAVDGRVRTFYGCSVVGVFEFQDRIAELDAIVANSSADTALMHLYQRDRKFRHACDRALELNGIKPEWVNAEMLIALLFDRKGEGEIIPAYLRQLNRPYEPKRKSKGVTLKGKAGLIAAIASHTGSIDEAYKLARTVPARELMAVLDARAELALTPEEREREEFDDWAAKARAKARAKVAA